MKCRLILGDRPETVLFLCEESEETARPWIEAGYNAICVDLAKDGQDVRLLRQTDIIELARAHHLNIIGCFAMPPCTHFAGSGARWWKAKGEPPLLEALSVSDACVRIAESLRENGLRWFVLENPVGRIGRFLGKPVVTFQPCEFGDPYTKRTCLWGWGFNKELPRNPVEPVLGSRMHLLPPSGDRARLRSVTPAGFAKAFFEANKGIAGNPAHGPHRP